MDTKDQHRVVLDAAGPGARIRLTCYEPGCAGATLIAKPHMTQAIWDKESDAFLELHPTDEVDMQYKSDLQIVI